MSHLLVTAAWAPELERFRELLAAAPRVDVELEAMGIGLVDAGIGLTRRIMTRRPRAVMALGTAGAAPGSGLSLHNVIVGEAVRLVDPVAVEGRAAMPFATEATVFDGAMIEALRMAGATPCAIANTASVTTDDGLATALASIAPVEHLEAYAVARACLAASVPCAVVLAIANVVGSEGRAAWRANHVAASARAAEIAFAALPRLGF